MKLKRLLQAGRRYALDKHFRFLIHARLGLHGKMEDAEYLRRRFQALMGKPLDLANPRSFNEKLQWLKLHDRNPDYTIMADKIAVKDYVARKIGQEYCIPTLGVWEKPAAIDFDALPEKFVLKCNHNSGLGMCICRDKAVLDRKKTRKALAKGLREKYYLKNREWPYKNIRPRILAEAFLECPQGELADYKIHCFHGQPRFILVCQDRFGATGLTEDFFTPQWEHMDLKRPGIPNAAKPIPAPGKLEEMLELAKQLSADIPFVRVDLYCVEDRIYFSELTFFPASGGKPFQPESWDEILGSWLKLP